MKISMTETGASQRIVLNQIDLHFSYPQKSLLPLIYLRTPYVPPLSLPSPLLVKEAFQLIINNEFAKAYIYFNSRFSFICLLKKKKTFDEVSEL